MKNYHKPCPRRVQTLINLIPSSDVYPALEEVIKEHAHITQHVIDTGDALPVKVSPRPIPFYLVDQVQQQLKDMAEEGIIRPSSSLWCAPAVYEGLLPCS